MQNNIYINSEINRNKITHRKRYRKMLDVEQLEGWLIKNNSNTGMFSASESRRWFKVFISIFIFINLYHYLIYLSIIYTGSRSKRI
jgi:hypothetical protein